MKDATQERKRRFSWETKIIFIGATRGFITLFLFYLVIILNRIGRRDPSSSVASGTDNRNRKRLPQNKDTQGVLVVWSNR